MPCSAELTMATVHLSAVVISRHRRRPRNHEAEWCAEHVELGDVGWVGDGQVFVGGFGAHGALEEIAVEVDDGIAAVGVEEDQPLREFGGEPLGGVYGEVLVGVVESPEAMGTSPPAMIVPLRWSSVCSSAGWSGCGRCDSGFGRPVMCGLAPARTDHVHIYDWPRVRGVHPAGCRTMSQQ